MSTPINQSFHKWPRYSIKTPTEFRNCLNSKVIHIAQKCGKMYRTAGFSTFPITPTYIYIICFIQWRRTPMDSEVNTPKLLKRGWPLDRAGCVIPPLSNLDGWVGGALKQGLPQWFNKGSAPLII